jgi:hypothetical protein
MQRIQRVFVGTLLALAASSIPANAAVLNVNRPAADERMDTSVSASQVAAKINDPTFCTESIDSDSPDLASLGVSVVLKTLSGVGAKIGATTQQAAVDSAGRASENQADDLQDATPEVQGELDAVLVEVTEVRIPMTACDPRPVPAAVTAGFDILVDAGPSDDLAAATAIAMSGSNSKTTSTTSFQFTPTGASAVMVRFHRGRPSSNSSRPF